MTDKNNYKIPNEVIMKLLNIVIIAIGNVLVIVGENMIQKGEDKLNSISKNSNNSNLE